jgi:hypothetical protein
MTQPEPSIERVWARVKSHEGGEFETVSRQQAAE